MMFLIAALNYLQQFAQTRQSLR